MHNLLTDNPFGTIAPPVSGFTTAGTAGEQLGKLIQVVIWLLIGGAGVYALINFILAGYAFLSAGDDPKKIVGAWAKIWQSALGLTVAAASLLLAAVFGILIFGNANAILSPTITPIQ